MKNMLGKIAGLVLIIIIVAVGVFGYTIYQKYSSLVELANCGKNCIDYKKVKVMQYETPVSDIKVIGADAEKLTMDVPLVIHNPSTKDTELLKIDFNMYMEGRHLAKGILLAQELPAKQNTTIWIKDVVIKYEELKEVIQVVAARHGVDILKEGKANITMTVDLLIYLPIKISAVNIYTFTIPIQIETEIPVDMLKQKEEANKQIEEKIKETVKEVRERVKESLPATTATPQKTILPSPTSTLPIPTITPKRPLPSPILPSLP